MRSYDLYGVRMASEHEFVNPLQGSSAPAGSADLVFTCVNEPPSWVDWSAGTVVDEQGRRPDGSPEFVFVRFPSHDVIRIPGALDFYVFDDRVTCHVVDDRHGYLVEIALLGMVLAFWLERRATLTLHASVAVLNGAAVGFLGSSGGGKTSTLLGCLARGHALLTDDLLAVREQDDHVRAERGYPALRLLPEQVASFVGGDHDLPLLHPGFEKRRVLVGDGGFGRFADGAAPLLRLYLPERGPAQDAPVVIERLRPDEAVMTLLRHSFLPREVQRFGWQARRLTEMPGIVRHVSVARLRYPSGFDRLPEVIAAVEQDLGPGDVAVS